MKELSINGTIKQIHNVSGVLVDLFSLLNDETFNSLFLAWYKNPTKELELKQLKKCIKRRLDNYVVKICIKDYSGVTLPCIKIKHNNVKIVTRVGFGVNIKVKECFE